MKKPIIIILTGDNEEQLETNINRIIDHYAKLNKVAHDKSKLGDFYNAYKFKKIKPFKTNRNLKFGCFIIFHLKQKVRFEEEY